MDPRHDSFGVLPDTGTLEMQITAPAFSHNRSPFPEPDSGRLRQTRLGTCGTAGPVLDFIRDIKRLLSDGIRRCT